MEVKFKKMFICSVNRDVLLCAQWRDQLDSHHRSFHSYDSSLLQPTLIKKISKFSFQVLHKLDFIKVEYKNHIQT